MGCYLAEVVIAWGLVLVLWVYAPSLVNAPCGGGLTCSREMSPQDTDVSGHWCVKQMSFDSHTVKGCICHVD